MKIRPATAADVDAIVVVLSANGETHLDGAYVVHVLETGHVVVAVDRDDVVGVGATIERAGIFHLADLYVDPQRHGQGVGTQLIDALAVTGTPCTTFSSGDPRALPLYVRAGLVPWWPLLYFWGRPTRRLAAPFVVEPAGPDDVAEVDVRVAAGKRELDHRYYAAQPGAFSFIVRDGSRAVAAGHWHGGVLDMLSIVEPADAAGAVTSVVAALAESEQGRVALAVPGPHPAVPVLLAAGLPINERDQYCTTDLLLVDPVRRLPNPGLCGAAMERRAATESAVKVLSAFSFATGTAWIAWHIVRGRAGAHPVLTGVLIVIELAALVRLIAFVVRTGAAPPAPLDAFDGDVSGTVVVLAEAHDLRTLRAAVLAARLAWNSEGAIVVDPEGRDDVRRLCAQMRVPLTAKVDDALAASQSNLVALVDGNHAVLPDVFGRAAPLLADETYGFVQGPVPTGDPLSRFVDEVRAPGDARVAAAIFRGTAVVFDPALVLDAGGIVDARHGGTLATTVALASAGITGRVTTDAFVTPVRPLDDATWRSDQTRRTASELRIFWQRMNPMWARSLRPAQRLVFIDEMLARLSGVGAFAAAAVAIVVLMTGRLPVVATPAALTLAGVAAVLTLAIHFGRGRGRLPLLAIAASAAASMGAHLRALGQLVRGRRDPVEVGPREPSGGRPAPRRVLLALTACALAGSVLARAVAMRFQTGVPALAPLASTASAVGALLLLAAFMEGAELFTLRPAEAPASVALSSDALGLEIVALDADRIELEAVTLPGAEVRAAIRLPTSTGSRPVTLTARVAWRRRIGEQRWRVAGPYEVTPPAAADDLLAHAVVTFPYQRARDGRSLLPDVQIAAFPPPSSPRPSEPTARGPLRFMAVASLIAVTVVALWPYPTAVALVHPREITGLVFDDQNADGVREAGLTLTEPGVGHVSVRGIDDGGNSLAAAITDADGHYHLTITSRVTRLFVVFDLPDGYSEGPHGPDSPGGIVAASVGDENVDVGLIRPADFCSSDTTPPTDTTAPTAPPTIVPTIPTPSTTSPSPPPTTAPRGEGEPVVCQPAPVEVGDHVWHDVNGDGVRQSTEPPLGGVRLELWSEGRRVGTAISDSSGGYAFSSLPAEATTGNEDAVGGGLAPARAVEVRVPDALGANKQLTLRGLAPTVSGAGTGPLAVTLDNDGVLRGDDAVATATAGPLGQIDHTVDFGFTSGMTVGNRVFNDLNANGRLDDGEPGLGGVTVTLFADPDGDGQHDTASMAATTTAPDGHWLLSDVAPGRYVIEASMPVGYISSTGTVGATSGPYEGPLTPKPGSAIDGDDNGTVVPGSVVSAGTANTPLVVRTKSFTLTAGGAPVGEQDRSTDDAAPDAWSDTTIDFGFFLPASLGGRVWQDTNRNGGRDEPSDSGTDGVFVRLYANGGRLVASTTTSQDPTNPDSVVGGYQFTNLAPGDYKVAVAGLPNGSTVVAPGQGDDRSLDSDVDPTTGMSAAVHLDAGQQSAAAIDAGWYGPSLSLGDTVWRDTNANGALDTGETGFDGVTVKLFKTDGTAAAPDQTTSGGGHYLFTALMAGDYVVEVLPPAGGWRASGPGATNQNVNDGKDGDNNGTPAAATPGLPIRTAVVHLASGTKGAGPAPPDHALPEGAKPEDADVSVDFGLYQPTDLRVVLTVGSTTPGPYTTGQEVVVRIEATNRGPGQAATGWKITDNFPSGLLPSAIDSGPSGCTLSGRALSCTSKTALAAAAAPVVVVVRATVVADPTVAGSAEIEDTVAIEPAPGDVAPIHPHLDPAGQSVDRIVLGLATTGVGGAAWVDQRHDGVRQPGEPALSGVRAKLLDASRSEVAVGPDAVLGTSDDARGGVLTSSTGRYHFTGLAPGSYYVQFELPAGYELTDAGPGSTVDPATMRTAAITLAAGVDSVRVDVGAHQSAGSIGDLVWADRNRDGRHDDAEPGIAGIPVSLLNSDLTPALGSTGGRLVVVTNGLGGYRFADLEPGQYVVSFPLPQGQQRSPRAAPGDDAIDADADPATGLSGVITVGAGTNVSTVDSGLFDTPTELGGIVWTDKDGNGRLDQGESAIAGAKVELLDAAGNPGATTTTGPVGRYQFVGVAPGRYAVRIDPATLPGGVAFTTRDVALTADVGSDVDDRTGTTVPIDVGRAYSSESWDIGLTFVGTVADGVWLDDGNGVRDAGEPLASGVGVALLDTTGAAVATTLTDDAGNYRFDHVRPATYTLAFSSFPAGFALTVSKATTDGTIDSDPDPASGHTDPFDVHGSDEGGFHGAGLTRPRATITGRAWVDQNTNGVFDDTEEAAVGLQVALLAADGRLVASGLVTGAGDYSFTNVMPGRFEIAYTLPAGLRLTAAGAKASRVDVATLRSEPFDVENGVKDDSWTLRAEQKPSAADEAVGAIQDAQHRFRRASRAGRVVLAASSAALASLAILRGWRQRRRRSSRE